MNERKNLGRDVSCRDAPRASSLRRFTAIKRQLLGNRGRMRSGARTQCFISACNDTDANEGILASFLCEHRPARVQGRGHLYSADLLVSSLMDLVTKDKPGSGTLRFRPVCLLLSFPLTTAGSLGPPKLMQVCHSVKYADRSCPLSAGTREPSQGPTRIITSL